VRPGTAAENKSPGKRVTSERRDLDDGGIVNDNFDGISLTVQHCLESGEREVPDNRGGN
ncbi:hypothetical protein ACHAWX_002143, partial [Stephanocyclus meneghinianus]